MISLMLKLTNIIGSWFEFCVMMKVVHTGICNSPSKRWKLGEWSGMRSCWCCWDTHIESKCWHVAQTVSLSWNMYVLNDEFCIKFNRYNMVMIWILCDDESITYRNCQFSRQAMEGGRMISDQELVMLCTCRWTWKH